MIQDIGASRFHIEYRNRKPDNSDIILRFNRKGEILLSSADGRLVFPTAEGLSRSDKTIYLFSMNETSYYLLLSEEHTDMEGFSCQGLREIRGNYPNEDTLIVFTAYHLWQWYMDNQRCGRCGHELIPHTQERALICKNCSHIVYPRINPAVIVGVTKGEQILITRYRSGFAHNALVAGFTEIGETLEQTVAREVMEETGIRVKNIRYYKSQPWGIAQDVLMGFFCEADGNDNIKMDKNELKYAKWVPRKEVELQPNDLSLTNEMMKMFKDGFV